MKKSELLDALKLCKSSLATLDFVPVLTHYCFDGDTIYAYDDVSAIVVPFESNVEAAVKGDTLLGVLNTLREDFEMEKVSDHVLAIRSGKAKIELAALPKDSFVFEMPDQERDQLTLPITNPIINGLRRCLETVGENALRREFTAVCVQVREGKLYLYSFDDVRMSRYCEDAPAKAKQGSWLLPAKSVQQLIEIAGIGDEEAGAPELQMFKDYATLVTDGALFYTKLMTEAAPDYATDYAAAAPKTNEWRPIPKGFVDALKRADILTTKEMRAEVLLELVDTSLKVSVGKENQRGHFSETFTVAGEPTKKPFRMCINPKKVHEAVSDAEEVAFGKVAVGLRTKGLNYTCLVAPLPSEE